MEYSLNILTKKLRSDTEALNLNLQEFIDVLNLIGFEVDDVNFNRSVLSNSFEIDLLIKLPSNREDLMIEKNFLNELSTIFLFKLNESWLKLKSTYFALLKNKYLQYYNYQEVQISSKYPQILSYLIELKDLKSQNSPKWIQSKLKKIGKKTNNDLSDVIELINFEWGQSFNCIPSLDLNKNIEKNIKIEILDQIIYFSSSNNKEHKLYPGTIVLKLNDEIISVLGLNNQITNKNENLGAEKKLIYYSKKTNSIYLQGFFYNIYNNELSLNYMQNKISLKALRKENLDNFRFAFQRLLTIFDLVYSPSISPIVYLTKNNNLVIKNKRILSLELNFLRSYINKKEIDFSIFEKAGLKIVCRTPDICYLSIPKNRKDLERKIDIVEEYSRFVGYKNFEEIYPKQKRVSSDKVNLNVLFLKQFFITNGFNEVLSNSIEDLKKNKDYSIVISNPLNSEFNVLRTDLSSNLINIFEENLRNYTQSNNFFEIGRIFKTIDKKILEIERFSGIFQLERLRKLEDNNTEWLEAKGLIERLLIYFGYYDLEFEKISEKFTNYHPTRSVFLKSGEKILGVFGQVNPKLKHLDTLKYATYLFEFNLSHFGIERLKKSQNKMFKENSKYPSIKKDISFSLNIQNDFLLLKKNIINSSNFLKNFEFFDVFFDSSVEGKVKIGIRLEFQSNIETLTNEFVENEMKNIKEILIKDFRVELY